MTGIRLWVKTVLMSYRYLERIVNTLDRLIVNKGLYCGDVLGQNFHRNNVLAVSESIINYSERKVTLINLNILIEESLSEIPMQDSQILIAKYIDGSKTEEMANRFGYSMRTLFRRINKAEKSFDSCLKRKGYDDKKLEEMLKDESWIINMHNSLSIEEEEIVERER